MHKRLSKLYFNSNTDETTSLWFIKGYRYRMSFCIENDVVDTGMDINQMENDVLIMEYK